MANIFELGKIVITANAKSVLSDIDVNMALALHTVCDWGDLDDEDRERNDRAVHNGDRLFSAYHDCTGNKFWIITEADRSYTTVMLPEDY